MTFRAYLIDRTGHISGPAKVVEGDTEEQAIEQAKRFLDGHDVEVWDGKRLVTRLKSSDAK